MVCSFAFDWVLDFRKNSVGILYWPCIRQGKLLELPSGTWFLLEIAFMMKMDEKDRLIVRLLREDARMPVSELSKRVGLSGPSTGDRMRRLEASGIISRFTARDRSRGAGIPAAGDRPDQAAAGQHAHCRGDDHERAGVSWIATR
jgi:hypothetical protein